MSPSRIAIFEGHLGDDGPGLPTHKSKRPKRKRSHSSPKQKAQQAKLKKCVPQCKGTGSFRSCMSTCLRKK